MVKRLLVWFYLLIVLIATTQSIHWLMPRQSGVCPRVIDAPLSTHWGKVTQIGVSKLNIIGSDNGLSPGRRQAIIWTSAGIFSIWCLWTNFSEVAIEIHTFLFQKMVVQMSFAKWWPFCLCLNVLRTTVQPQQNKTYQNVSAYTWSGTYISIMKWQSNWLTVFINTVHMTILIFFKILITDSV